MIVLIDMIGVTDDPYKWRELANNDRHQSTAIDGESPENIGCLGCWTSGCPFVIWEFPIFKIKIWLFLVLCGCMMVMHGTGGTELNIEA